MVGNLWVKFSKNKSQNRNSLAVKGLGLHALIAQGPGSIPGQGTKNPQAVQHTQWGRWKSGDMSVGDVSPMKVPQGTHTVCLTHRWAGLG